MDNIYLINEGRTQGRTLPLTKEELISGTNIFSLFTHLKSGITTKTGLSKVLNKPILSKSKDSSWPLLICQPFTSSQNLPFFNFHKATFTWFLGYPFCFSSLVYFSCSFFLPQWFLTMDKYWSHLRTSANSQCPTKDSSPNSNVCGWSFSTPPPRNSLILGGGPEIQLVIIILSTWR